MDKKVLDLAGSVSLVLSVEKAYHIPDICNKYDLGDGRKYAVPGSKDKFIKNLLLVKNEDFIIDLANKVVNDYKSDALGSALNQYYDGKFYKLSVITRKEMLFELFSIGNLNGKLPIDEFLKACELQTPVLYNLNEVFGFLFDGKGSIGNGKVPDLIDILNDNKIHEMLDEHFFQIIEQIVHPYTRLNSESKEYIFVINKHLKKDNFSLIPLDEISGQQVYKIISGAGFNEGVKNLIFSSNKYKPEIVLDDALSNRIRIVRNSEYCLVYDRPITPSGLLWVDLVKWWSDRNGMQSSKEQAIELKNRLSESLASKPEQILFQTYYGVFPALLNRKLPALVPQVYLHFDPYSIRQHGIQYLLRQRMDFLLLLSKTTRIVIEVDGKQHYSESEISSPRKYAEMVSLDRELKLLGYEVYRFGGYELLTKGNDQMIIDFFQKLFKKHGLL